MDLSREEYHLQRAMTILLLERVLYFLPSFLIYPLGYRVLPSAHGKRKVIMRFAFRDGWWVRAEQTFASFCLQLLHRRFLMYNKTFAGASFIGWIRVVRCDTLLTQNMPRSWWNLIRIKQCSRRGGTHFSVLKFQHGLPSITKSSTTMIMFTCYKWRPWQRITDIACQNSRIICLLVMIPDHVFNFALWIQALNKEVNLQFNNFEGCTLLGLGLGF